MAGGCSKQQSADQPRSQAGNPCGEERQQSCDECIGELVPEVRLADGDERAHPQPCGGEVAAGKAAVVEDVHLIEQSGGAL